MTTERYNKIFSNCYDAGEKFGVRGLTKSNKFNYDSLRAYFNVVIKKFSYVSDGEKEEFFIDAFMSGFIDKVC